MLEVSKSAAIFTRLNIIIWRERGTKKKRSGVRKVIFGFREIQWMVWSIETYSTKSPIESSMIYILIHTNRFNYKISSNPCDSSNSLEISHRFSNLKILKNMRKLKQQDTNGQRHIIKLYIIWFPNWNLLNSRAWQPDFFFETNNYKNILIYFAMNRHFLEMFDLCSEYDEHSEGTLTV